MQSVNYKSDFDGLWAPKVYWNNFTSFHGAQRESKIGWDWDFCDTWSISETTLLIDQCILVSGFHPGHFENNKWSQFK